MNFIDETMTTYTVVSVTENTGSSWRQGIENNWVYTLWWLEKTSGDYEVPQKNMGSGSELSNKKDKYQIVTSL